MNYQVLIVDDYPLYRLALKGAVAAACTDSELFEADSVAGLFDALDRHPRVDLLLLDLNLPGAFGFNALAHLRGSHPELPIIVVSASDDPPTMRRALALGAQGFVSKSADAATIGHSVQAVLRGEVVTPAGLAPEEETDAEAGVLEVAQRLAQLTPLQFRVLGMLCAGRPNQQIAHELQITAATVKGHMTVILRKLSVANRTQAALLAGRLARGSSDIKPLRDGIEG
jgi:DNA-binding NarL/FixJ family response regulator